jgi:hypothetical protein
MNVAIVGRLSEGLRAGGCRSDVGGIGRENKEHYMTTGVPWRSRQDP